ncbi:MAG: sterol desaturase family protein [Planctomycetota bacterium]
MESAIALSVPVFLLLMAVELGVNVARTGESGYTLQDTLNNLACGIGQQLFGVAFKTATAAAYLYLYARTPLRLPEGWPGFLIALVTTDFCYYWFHRAGHRVNLVWAGHAVHHQSEEMNLSVALRQSWFVQAVAWVFYLPLAALGLAPELFVAANLTTTLYQFWIHTEAIRKAPRAFEWLFNTPSHHRVHHGTNPRYLDANYAGLLMLWDRLFGTFVPEEEEVVYGTVAPLRSWDPLWANLTYVAGFLRLAGRAPRWWQKLWAPFAPPEWRPAELGGPVTAPPVTRAAQVKYSAQASPATGAYVSAQFVPALVIATLLLGFHRQLGAGPAFAVAVWVFLTLQAVGGLLESRPWARPLELARLALLLALAAWLAPGAWGLVPLAWAALSVLALTAAPIAPAGRQGVLARAGPSV